MSQTARSTTTPWSGMWESLICNVDEWLPYKNELGKKDIDDPSLKLTKYEIAEQVLHDIEDLGRSNTGDWLDEFPHFEEIQTLPPTEVIEIDGKNGKDNVKCEQEQLSPYDGSVVPEVQQQLSNNQDLLSVSYESAATFILSDENILFINNEPFANVPPFEPAHTKARIEKEEIPLSEDLNEKKSNDEAYFLWTELDSTDVKTEMAVVDEIIRNTALELDQWESDTSRSETSSDGTSATDLSSKEKEDETDDPDWMPDSPKFSGRKCGKRPKPYWRGRNQEEKKLRKKEQNKNAATRYRQKKKAEIYEILMEEKLLKEKKAKLEKEVDDIQSEIKCVKALMRDLFKAKGIIN